MSNQPRSISVDDIVTLVAASDARGHSVMSTKCWNS